MPMRQNLLNYQPISAFQRYLYSLALDFQNVYFFMWIWFLIGTLLIAGGKGISIFFSVLFILSASHFLRRTVQYFIDFRQKKNSISYLIAALSLTVAVSLVINSYWFILFLILLNTLLFLLGFFLDLNIIEKKKVTTKKRNRSWALKMILNNKNI